MNVLTTTNTASIPATLDGATDLEAQLAKIQAKYEPQITALQQAAQKEAEDMPSKEEIIVNIDVDEWERVEWKFDLPEVSMRLKTWKLHIPEVFMREKRWVFDLPEPGMVYKKFPWGGGMHVPGIKMKRHEWKVKIPEITMLPQEWKLHIPEVTMKEHRWVFDLPKITVGGPEDELEAKQKAATSYGQKAQKLAEAMSDEIELAAKDYLLDVRKEIDGQFTGPIAQLEASLAAAPNESIRAEITANLNDLRSKRTEALAQVDQQIVLLTQ